MYMGPPKSVSSLTRGGPLDQTSFFAYYMGPPSRQFLRLLYGGLLRPVSSLTMLGPPRSVSSHTIWGSPSGQFLRLLYMEPLRSVLHTIWGPLQINFFAYYVGAPLDKFLRKLYGVPSGQFLRLV